MNFFRALIDLLETIIIAVMKIICVIVICGTIIGLGINYVG